MNIFEYLLGDNSKDITFDEKGNARYPADLAHYPCRFSSLDDWMNYIYAMDEDNDFYFLEKERFEQICKIDLIIPDGFDYASENVVKPYYRLRGKPVTEEQAFDIIRRTDTFFYKYDLRKDYVQTISFNNCQIARHYYGWCHVDGTIGQNYFTMKFPYLYELLQDWVELLIAFPYLDLMVAVTDWDEVPDDYDIRKDFEAAEYDEDFYNHIQVGILVHDSVIQILRPEEAVAKYKEYDSLYGKDRERFNPNYYFDNKIFQVSTDYLKRCIEVNGVSPEVAVRRIGKYGLKILKEGIGFEYTEEELKK